jgi:hypothetical protein
MAARSYRRLNQRRRLARGAGAGYRGMVKWCYFRGDAALPIRRSMSSSLAQAGSQAEAASVGYAAPA